METDGRLPSGETVPDAIARVDAETDGAAAYFMINCAHPAHSGQSSRRVARGLTDWAGSAPTPRASHAELDQAPGLDSGDPQELGAEYRALKPYLDSVRVLGGCCGTDTRHVARICAEWLN